MIEWVLANKPALIEAFLAVLGLASIVARLTPTEVDNKALDAIVKVIHTIGLTKAK